MALTKNKQEISPPCAVCGTRHRSPGLWIALPAFTRNLMVRKKQPGLREAAKQRMMQQQDDSVPICLQADEVKSFAEANRADF